MTDVLRFIGESPSPFHACATAAARLEGAGFEQLREDDAWPGGPGRWFIVRGGSLVAWQVPDGETGGAGFRIVGAHTDSPNLRIKPRPDASRAGLQQLAVEVYGGPLLNSWLDRDLGLSGRVALAGGGHTLVKVDRPVLRIPQLAIHLDRDVNDRGLQLNPQTHLVPIWATGPLDAGGFRRFLATEAGVDADDVVDWDAMLHDTQPGAVTGRDGEFLSSARLDNLCCSWAAVEALAAAVDAPERPGHVPVVCLFDHEEVGSGSERGAAGPLLPTVLERIVLAGGGDREAWHRALARSRCVSADMAHATHPNYQERHEPSHPVVLNGGPVVKSNAAQRYATDALGSAFFLEACERAGVPVQRYVNRSDLPCGSTIGPLTAARLGVPTVDVGVAQLAMHSARELCGAADPGLLVRALTAFFA